MKRITILFMSLFVAAIMMAANKNGRFFLRFNDQQVSTENVVENFSRWFSLPAETEWREVSRTTDHAGMERIVYRQYVDRVEVEHSQVILHARNGMVRSANGMVMETHRTPAKLRKQVVGKNGVPKASNGRNLLLVNTSEGYRYAYKVLSIKKTEWIYYDAETDTVIKRVATRHRFDTPTGNATTVTGKSFYSGDVELDVMQGDDGITYLYDEARNIHTLNGAYLKTFEELADEGILYNYFPQGDFPDYNEANEEEKMGWLDMLMELGDNNQLDGLDSYIKDFSSYITSPDGKFSAYKVKTIGVSKVTVPDDEDNLVSILPLDEGSEAGVPNVIFYLRYGTDEDNISNGVLEDLEVSLNQLTTPLDLSSVSEIIPKEGMTIVVALGEPDNDEYEDDDYSYIKKAIDDDDYDYDDDDDDATPDFLAITSFVPDATGKFEFENDRIAFTITYEPAGDPTVDIHWGMGKTLDFYDEVFNRKSYDGNGAPVYNLIYLNTDETASLLANPTTNAGALGTQAPYPMVYGIGGIDFAIMNPVVELSVMAHEFTHIITGVTANLEYAGESGALNESFSDIMGICTKKYATNAADWFIGENVFTENTNMRDMSAPKESMDGENPAPDTYGGEYWVDPDDTSDGDDGGVHTNSGVQNKWYYLLTEGGSGTNDNGYDYDMEGIGIEKSRQIAYLTLTSYASEQSDYAAISEASIEAAGVLYGENGEEVNAVINAWKAVGVIDTDYSTGIQRITTTETDGNRYYDLQGRLLEGKPSMKGIYVRDGRKIIVR